MKGKPEPWCHCLPEGLYICHVIQHMKRNWTSACLQDASSTVQQTHHQQIQVSSSNNWIVNQLPRQFGEMWKRKGLCVKISYTRLICLLSQNGYKRTATWCLCLHIPLAGYQKEMTSSAGCPRLLSQSRWQVCFAVPNSTVSVLFLQSCFYRQLSRFCTPIKRQHHKQCTDRRKELNFKEKGPKQAHV